MLAASLAYIPQHHHRDTDSKLPRIWYCKTKHTRVATGGFHTTFSLSDTNSLIAAQPEMSPKRAFLVIESDTQGYITREAFVTFGQTAANIFPEHLKL